MERNFRFIIIIAFSLASGVMSFAQTKTGATKGQLAGTVVEAAEGFGLRHAYILVHRDDEDQAIVAHVDSRGMFTLSLEPGLYDVLETADGFVPMCRKVEIKRGNTTEFNSSLKADNEHLQR